MSLSLLIVSNILSRIAAGFICLGGGLLEREPHFLVAQLRLYFGNDKRIYIAVNGEGVGVKAAIERHCFFRIDFRERVVCAWSCSC